jgi:hypothetical protein
MITYPEISVNDIPRMQLPPPVGQTEGSRCNKCNSSNDMRNGAISAALNLVHVDPSEGDE